MLLFINILPFCFHFDDVLVIENPIKLLLGKTTVNLLHLKDPQTVVKYHVIYVDCFYWLLSPTLKVTRWYKKNNMSINFDGKKKVLGIHRLGE